MNSYQSGNVLFLILIAVALFAALSYAVTSSSRSGGGSSPKESSQTSAGRIFNFDTAIRSGIMRLKLRLPNGVSDMNFSNDIYSTMSGSVLSPMGSPSDPTPYLFHPQGGGVIPQTFVDLSIPCPTCDPGTRASGHVAFFWTNAPSVGTSESDQAFRILNLKKDVCEALNERIGINLIPRFSSFPISAIAATFSTSPNLAIPTGDTTADDTAIVGKESFCFQESVSPFRYIYTSVFQAF